MLTINHGKDRHEVVFEDNDLNQGTLNGQPFSMDLAALQPGSYHLILRNRSFNLDVEKLDRTEKKAVIRVNGQRFEFAIKDRMDQLLERLGMSDLASKKVQALKAPMPGLVLDVLVQEGDTIEPEAPLVVLEAMKMENILKAPVGTTVKSVPVAKGQTVEKGQVLINFE
ncbi:MAG: acetyl-CoA carboxylase biotin carboxyl carrier protein subunit [Bacteroidota bacterium]